jgi:hypothetical protein
MSKFREFQMSKRVAVLKPAPERRADWLNGVSDDLLLHSVRGLEMEHGRGFRCGVAWCAKFLRKARIDEKTIQDMSRTALKYDRKTIKR